MVVSAPKVKAMPSRNLKDAVQCGSGLENLRIEARNAFLLCSSLPTKAFRRCCDLLLHHPHRLPMPTVFEQLKWHPRWQSDCIREGARQSAFQLSSKSFSTIATLRLEAVDTGEIKNRTWYNKNLCFLYHVESEWLMARAFQALLL